MEDRNELRKRAYELLDTYPEKAKELLEQAEKLYFEELKNNHYKVWFANKQD